MYDLYLYYRSRIVEKTLKQVPIYSDGNNLISNAYSYGIENYYYVFETMIDKLFDVLEENEKKKYNPNGYWQLNNQKAKKASELRPDTYWQYQRMCNSRLGIQEYFLRV